MTDRLTRQLLPASFRGVEFQIRNEVLPEEGRKIILHEYLNSDQRFVEDQGQLPSKFRVQAFVHGLDFKERAAALRQALNEAGPGRLVLPTFGTQNVYALPYSIDTAQTAVGEIVFGLEFAAGRPAAGPSASKRDLQEVFSLGDDSRTAIEQALAGAWQPPSIAADAVVAQYDVLQSIDGAIDAVSQSIPSASLSSLSSLSSKAGQNIAGIVRSGSALASTFVGSSAKTPGLFQQISEGLSSFLKTSNAVGLFDRVIGLTEFGSALALVLVDINRASTGNQRGAAIPLWPQTTASRILRNDNRRAVSYAVRANALVLAYEVAAAQRYKTIDQINATRATLENANERLLRVETSDASIIQSAPDVREAVQAVRLASLDVLGQQRQQAFDNVEIEKIAPVPTFVEAFNLYAEQFTNPEALGQRAIDLRNLNPAQPVLSLNGPVTVFRNV